MTGTGLYFLDLSESFRILITVSLVASAIYFLLELLGLANTGRIMWLAAISAALSILAFTPYYDDAIGEWGNSVLIGWLAYHTEFIGLIMLLPIVLSVLGETLHDFMLGKMTGGGK